MNADVNVPLPVPPDLALATSVGYLVLEARREGFPLVAHLLEVALDALEGQYTSQRLSILKRRSETV